MTKDAILQKKLKKISKKQRGVLILGHLFCYDKVIRKKCKEKMTAKTGRSKTER